MPIFEFLCTDCGKESEILVIHAQDSEKCPSCGSTKLKKILSPHSSYTGATSHRLPGAGDTACCGSSPTQASCAGPGSCCGRGPTG